MARMKKTKSTSRKVRPMGARGPKTVAEYLAGVPEPARTTLTKMRAVILSAAPAETTEGIGYRLPMFKHNGMLVALGAFKNHCSLFPGSSVLDDVADEIKKYRVSKGTLQFPLDKPMPATLVRKIVKLRVAQNESKKRR